VLFCAGYLLQDTTSVFYCCLHFVRLSLTLVFTMMELHLVVMALWWNQTRLRCTRLQQQRYNRFWRAGCSQL